jgi:peptidoglycan/xylan/chitin deacetylase (PgdA/CDA1 family)
MAGDTGKTMKRVSAGSVCQVWLRNLLLLLCLLANATQAAVILQYHHVSDDTPASTSISPQLFEQHLAYLADNGFQVWPLPTLIEHLKVKKALPDKVVVITFDDAYDSIYQRAFPLLKARAFPFTVFVSPQPIEQKLKSFMSWPQLAEMQQAGATVANHSFEHAHLVRRLENETEKQWLKRIEDDIERAQQILSSRLGDLPKLLAYPYGEFDRRLAEKMAEMGYVAFGQQSGAVSDLHTFAELPRFPMTNVFGEMSQFKTKVASLPFPALSVSPDRRLIDKASQPKQLRIRLHPQAVHEQQISCYFSGKGRLPVQVNRASDAILLEIDTLPDMPPGRARLNCTAPSSDNKLSGRFHWFSWFWMRKHNDGRWYEED